MGVLAIRKRDFKRHGEWMIRAFAVAMPAGSLIFIVLPLTLVLGELPEALDEGIQSAAWVVHLGVAEWLIRRNRVPSAKAQIGSNSRDSQKEFARATETTTASPSKL